MTGFSVTIQMPVPWSDLDLFEHVNNVAYFRYFQAARITYFDKVGLMRMHRETNIGPILHSTSGRFVKELNYPDEIMIGAKVSSMRTSSFVLDYQVESLSSGIVAEGSSVNMIFDFNTKQKAPIPEALRAEICTLEQKIF